MARPTTNEYAPFYHHYVTLAGGDEVVSVLEKSLQPLQEWLATLSDKDMGYQYAEGKWTIGQVLQHMIDTERVFSFRAMCFARGEQQPLPGFDENLYAAAAPAAGRKWKGLAEELLTLRKASIILFRSIAKENALHHTGVASGNTISVNALGFILAGHVLHHKTIISERYGAAPAAVHAAP